MAGQKENRCMRPKLLQGAGTGIGFYYICLLKAINKYVVQSLFVFTVYCTNTVIQYSKQVEGRDLCLSRCKGCEVYVILYLL